VQASSTKRRKICVFTGTRAEYGLLYWLMKEIEADPRLELEVLVSGSHLAAEFGATVKQIETDGIPVSAKVDMHLVSDEPVAVAKSMALGLSGCAEALGALKPDIMVVLGDRYEALAAAVAAAYMNICIAHIQGGEVSGSIDESARHAISKFAHFHFPSTRRSAEYLLRMGERPDSILGIGCPSGDIARQMDRVLTPEMLHSQGSGRVLDLNRPFLLAIFHPTTTEYGGERPQMEALLAALDEVGQQTVLLWPNIDAGADHVSKAIRAFRDRARPAWLRTLINLPPEDYLKVLANTACAIGNSSSFVRDAGYFGTPVVLVGDRQKGRETDAHVTCVRPAQQDIAAAIRLQLERGRYPPSQLYGDGHVSQRIADQLAGLSLYVQKRLYFVHEPEAQAVPARRTEIAGNGAP